MNVEPPRQLRPIPWLPIAAAMAVVTIVLTVIFWDRLWPPGPEDFGLMALMLLVLVWTEVRRRGES